MNTENKEYVIVKHAQDDVWEYYWDNDPKLGVIAENSALFSYTGKVCEIKQTYSDLSECQEDVKKMNESNPVGAYAACLLIKDK